MSRSGESARYTGDLRILVLSALFASGAAAIAVQLAWTRILGIIYGTSSLAVATTVAVFMLGLGIGSRIGGNIAERSRNLLRAYALIEIGIAIAGTAGILLAKSGLFSMLHSTIYQMAGHFSLNLARLGIAAILLIPSTLCMGMTVPVLLKFLASSDECFGRDASIVYALNTLGALAGCLLTGFFLFRFAGITATFAIAFAANAIIGLAFLYQSRSCPANSSGEEKRNEIPADRASWILPVVFMMGASALALEVIWTRILSVYTLGTAYSFTTILAGFLAGIGLASLGASRWADTLKRPAPAYAALSAVLGLAGILFLAVFTKASFILALAERILAKFAKSANPLFADLACAFLASVGPAIVMGAIFPLGLKLYAGTAQAAGAKTGRYYLANTLGGVAGSLAAGFILIPLLGMRDSTLAVALLSFASGAYVIYRTPGASPSLRRTGYALIGIVSAASLIATPLLGQTYARLSANEQILLYKEGLSATVTVTRNSSNNSEWLTLLVDNQSVAGTSPNQIVDSKILAHIPLLLHPSPKKAFTLGYGTGGTSYSMLLHGVDVTAAEIEAKVLDAAPYFQNLNGGTLGNPKLQVVLDDGRNYLANTKQHFDVIVTDVTNLKYKSNPSLYSLEYFEIMRSRLAQGGIAAAWVPLSALAYEDLQVILATWQRVFPHTSVWYYTRGPSYFLTLVGTEKWQRIDLDRLGQRMSGEIKDDLRSIGIETPGQLAACLIAGEEDVWAATKDSFLHTDDLPILEFENANAYLVPETDTFMVLEIKQPGKKDGDSASGRQKTIKKVVRSGKGGNLGMLLRTQHEDLTAYFAGTSEASQELRKSFDEAHIWLPPKQQAK